MRGRKNPFRIARRINKRSNISPGLNATSKLDQSDFERPLLIWHRDPQSLHEAVDELLGVAAKSGKTILVLTDRSDIVNRAHTRVVCAGQFGANGFAVNPFEVLPGTDVRCHIQQLMSLFQRLLQLTDPVTYLLGEAVQLAYRRRGWNLLSGKNQRATGASYDADLHPDLQDVLDALPVATEGANLLPYVAMDAESSLRTILTRLNEGLPGQTFSKRTTVSVASLFAKDSFVDTRLISSSQNSRALIDGLLLLFLGEYHSTNASETGSTLILFDYESFCNRMYSVEYGNRPWFFEMANRLARKGIGSAVSISADKISDTALKTSRFETLLLSFDQIQQLNQRRKIVRVHNGSKFSGHAIVRNYCATNLCLSSKEGQTNQPGFYDVANAKLFSIPQLLSHGYHVQPEAFTPEAVELARTALKDRAVFLTVQNFLLRVMNDSAQLSQSRAEVIHEVQRKVLRAPVPLTYVTWCIISFATDAFFSEKARVYSWSMKEEADIRDGWYALLRPAFVPGGGIAGLMLKKFAPGKKNILTSMLLTKVLFQPADRAKLSAVMETRPLG